MNVPGRIIALFLLSAFLISSGISLFVNSLHHDSGQRYLQAAGLVFVVLFIAIAGKLLHYQQALSRAKQNLDEAQQLAGLGSWERDLATGRGYWSENCYRLFNLSSNSPVPSMEEFFLMIHDEDRESVRETVMGTIRVSGCYEVKYRLDNDAGNRTFLSRGKVMLDGTGQPVTMVGSIQDITHKQRRDQFREGLLKQKDLFISRLGHDLKTPLTPLVALLPLVRSRIDDKRQLELLDLCINNVSYISSLVAKTLLLGRLATSDEVSAGRMNIQLSALVESVISCAPDAVRDHVAIDNFISPDVAVRGNRVELEELFSQLLNNAAKFSPQGSSVVVVARCEGDMVAIDVRDSGIGLFPEEMVHIFEDFYKADPSRHLLGSCGLGLTICRRIVESHGGRISASSPGRDGGTTISFTLEAGGSV
ncbi:MAG: hypothetical protein A2076_16725 [Geobacteraceae bacterium GWC2_53_11]|nr:MAG: hypothetical protein A2076_16725 [Geobacteraceae bacterium GWC2_53_11]